jgi:hypothetical protein
VIWVFWIAFVVVPFGTCLVVPASFRYVVSFGAVAAGVEWALAYRESQVEHGGDSQPGTELLAFTGFFAALSWVLWFSFALLGTALARRRRSR